MSPSTARPAIDTTRLGSMVDALVGATEPGLAITLIVRGEPVWSHCAGLANLEFGVPIGLDTRFRIASMTKQFTAWVVLQLADEGRLDLDDPVRRHLPEMDGVAADASLRHLLAMSSGLHELGQLAFLAQGDLGELRWPPAEYQRLIGSQPVLGYPPGTDYLYNNGNYLLLQWVVERLCGQPLGRVMQERLFEPLGMHDTVLPERLHEAPSRLADGYQKAADGRFDRCAPWSNSGAAGGLISTLADLQRWQANLRANRLEPRDAPQRLMRGFVHPNGCVSHYGFGLMHDLHGGRRWVGHAGGLAGCSADQIWFPDEDVAVLALANRDDIKTMRLTRRIADHLFDGRSLLDHAGPGVGDTRPPASSSAELRRFEGVYANAAARRVVHVEVGPSLLTANKLLLEPVSANQLRILVGDVPLRYELLEDHCLLERRPNGTATELCPTTLQRPSAAAAEELVGEYGAAWLDACWVLSRVDGRLQMAVRSAWRHGERFELLQAAADLFVMAALDAPIPEAALCNSVIAIERDGAGAVRALSCHFDRSRGMQLSRQPSAIHV